MVEPTAMDPTASETRLLVLDDDSAVGETISLMARRIGIECHFTTTAAKFLSELKRWKPTHITLDLAMPERDGIEILHRLAELRADAMIILVSGVDARVLDAAHRAAKNHGLNIVGAIAKPFTLAALREVLAVKLEQPAAASGSRGPRALSINGPMLTRGLDSGQFGVAYQPKVSCADGTLSGFEALARWSHPKFGMIAPDQFIPVAERTGLCGRLSDTIFDLAFAWFGSPARPSLTLAINVSAKLLADPALADRLAWACERYGLTTDQVIIEVTESSAIYDQTAALDLLVRLRLKGFRLSIDDFGVGYSSLSQLAHLPFSELKIDRSFISTASHSVESRNIVKGIVGLARSLGLATVAEGVEDFATFNFLRETGCDQVQGFLIGHPMSPHDVSLWLGEQVEERLVG